jgi:molecular chaperone DnaK
MNNVFIGIDLGTTNSTIAAFDGELVNVIPNCFGENLTPSVIRIDNRGGVAIGRRACRYLDSDPANTRREFKRLMGTEVRLEFAASGSSFLPEELSSRILTSLLTDAADVLGFTPRAAVISTPALFELPQNHATMRAGKLAGLEEILLIQEPVASAIAAGWREDSPGMWLIFDLGGGTLDISLLETRDGRLRVVDHSGDNFLGGKDFDNALADWALDRLRENYSIPDLRRENPAGRPALARLKNACEQAKIELSRMNLTSISIPELCTDATGCPVEVDLEVTRTEYEGIVAPLVRRARAVCLSLIEKCRVSPDEIGRVVFVGGPTMTPSVRRVIGDEFGGRVATGIDPMTAVARGAALYAATAGLDAKPAKSAGVPPTGLALRIEHPPVTADLEPFVVGRFLPGPGEELPAHVHLCRDDGFTGAGTEVGTEGTFVLQAPLRRHCRNSFQVHATDAAGGNVPLATPDFAIVHGISVSDPPLSRSVGVALADDTVHVYFKKGTALPARKTFIHQTVRSVSATSGEDALSVPIIQGEFHRAHRNCLIGSLAVGGVGCTLPAGSRVEVTLHLDRSGQMHARADIPAIGRTFDNVVHIMVPTASLETLEKGLVTAESRSNRLLRRVFRVGDSGSARTLDQLPALLAEAKRSLDAARGGDDDAAQRLRRILLEIESTIDSVEETLEWPDLVDEANERIDIAISWVSAWGTTSEQALLDQAIIAAKAAFESRDPLELDRQVKAMRNLANAAYGRDPRSVFMTFDWYTENIASATDIPQATELLNKGRKAAQQGDAEALKVINRQLDSYFPGTEEERRRSFGSGVR